MSISEKLQFALYRFKYRYGQHLPLKVPVDVSLELAAACNQRCGYCYHADQSKLPFTKGFMSKELAFEIISQCATLGVNSLKFNWRGESTLNPHFKDITAFAKSFAGGSTFIDRLTNSNFKFPTHREDIFEGLCNQTKVKVSFDSFIKEVLETQRAGAKYEQAIANIDKFYNHPLRKETELVIQAVRTTRNANEDIESEVRKRWPSASVSVREMVEGRVEKDLSDLANKHRDADNRQACLQAFVRIIFTHDGKASPCCPSISDTLFIGDIRQNTVAEIFNSAFAKQLRKDLKSKKAFELDPCKTCSSHESYKGYQPNWVA